MISLSFPVKLYYNGDHRCALCHGWINGTASLAPDEQQVCIVVVDFEVVLGVRFTVRSRYHSHSFSKYTKMTICGVRLSWFRQYNDFVGPGPTGGTSDSYAWLWSFLGVRFSVRWWSHSNFLSKYTTMAIVDVWSHWFWTTSLYVCHSYLLDFDAIIHVRFSITSSSHTN